MTVGVMCSCFLSFPRFCRYHLSAIKSVLAVLRSSLRIFHFPRGRNRSSDDISSPGVGSSTLTRPVTRNIRAKSPASAHASDPDWLSPSDSTRNFSPQTINVPEPTHREHYEGMAEEQRSHDNSPLASHDQHSRQSRIQNNSPTTTNFRLPNSRQAPRTKPSHHGAWWKIQRQSNTNLTGYWDVMSIFRTNTTTSPGQSKMQSESGSNAV